MSFRGNLKKSIALRLQERLDAAQQFANPNHCGPGQGGGRFTDKEGTTCETGLSDSGGGIDPGDVIPKVPKGGFPADQYDEKKGKPIPGTDAWLHAHGISKNVWNDRPYVRFEEGDSFESLPESVQALYENEPEAKRQLLNMMGQTGGLIMVRKPVPGGENVVPQSRPDKPVVTDLAKRAFRKTALDKANARLEQMKALNGKDDLLALQQERVDRAHANLEAAKVIDRDGYLAYARGAKADAEARVAELKGQLVKKGGTGKSIDRVASDPAILEEYDKATKKLTRAEKNLEIQEADADRKFGSATDSEEVRAEKTAKYRELETNNALKAVARSEKKLEKIKGLDEAGVQEQIGNEIKTAQGFADSAQNAYDKTAAKYLFPPNPSALKDAIQKGEILGKAGRVNVHGAENLDNLVNGKGRVYLAMEGNIKEDSLLAAAKRELEPGAAVISVPSVTLWRHQEMVDVAEKYLSGREVVLIPDADGVNNPRVRNEARAMQALLEGAGAKVVVAPPPIPLDKNGKPLPKMVPVLDKNTGKPVLDAEGVPVMRESNKVQQFSTVIPGSPKGTREELKGVDDYLGLGADTPPHPQTGERAMGVLGNLAVQRREVPPIDLSGEVSAKAKPNAEAALRAISLIAGSKEVASDSGGKVRVAAGQIGTTMLAAAMGKPGQLRAAGRSLDVLEQAGIIKIERVYDEEALSRGIRRQNPNMTDARLNELVRAGVIDRPSFEEEDTRPVEYGYEETPIVSINPAYKGFDGKVRDYTARDDTPVSLNSLGTHDVSATRIRALRNTGLTYDEIADILGVSNTTIEEAIN